VALHEYKVQLAVEHVPALRPDEQDAPGLTPTHFIAGGDEIIVHVQADDLGLHALDSTISLDAAWAQVRHQLEFVRGIITGVKTFIRKQGQRASKVGIEHRPERIHRADRFI